MTDSIFTGEMYGCQRRKNKVTMVMRWWACCLTRMKNRAGKTKEILSKTSIYRSLVAHLLNYFYLFTFCQLWLHLLVLLSLLCSLYWSSFCYQLSCKVDVNTCQCCLRMFRELIYCACVFVHVSSPYLQDDISPGQTASPAEADLHVVKSTVSLGDVPKLRIATALW